MVNRLPAWIFLSISLLLIGAALLPAMRLLFGVDKVIAIQFLTMVMLLIAGLMSGLTAMILMVRRQAKIDWQQGSESKETGNVRSTSLRMHACGLLLFTGVPLLNFLVAYWLWIKHRRSDPELDSTGKEVLNFQITWYLYLMLSLFMVFAALGLVTTPALLLLHLIFTTAALWRTARGKEFLYPGNIPIIQGRPASTPQ